MYAVHCVLLREADEGQSLVGTVGKLLFHHEGGGELIAQVEPPALDEAVHAGPQRNGFHQGGYNDVEKGVFEVNVPGVLLRQVGVDGRQVDLLLDKGLIVGPVGHQVRGDLVEGVLLPEPPPVPPIAPAAFGVVHCDSSLHYIHKLYCYSTFPAIFPDF